MSQLCWEHKESGFGLKMLTRQAEQDQFNDVYLVMGKLPVDGSKNPDISPKTVRQRQTQNPLILKLSPKTQEANTRNMMKPERNSAG